MDSIRHALDDELPVLGFAGAPLTLASFLLEGESPSASLTRLRSLMVEEPAACHRLLELLADTTIAYLRYQIDEGAHAVQLFESVADLLTPEEYETFAHPYQVKVFGELGRAVPTLRCATPQPRVDLWGEGGDSSRAGGGSLGLRGLASKRLNVEMTAISDLVGSGAKQITMADVSVEQASPYACADADMTGRLRPTFEAEPKEQGLWPLSSEIELPLVPVLQRMEQAGVAIDADSLRKMSRSMGEQIVQLEHEAYDSFGHQFKPAAPQQLLRRFFDELARIPSADC